MSFDPIALPISLRLYSLAARAIAPWAPAWLAHRVRRGKEDAGRISERLGRAVVMRPPGRLIWLHGASVGESLALLPVIDQLRLLRPEMAILVTSGTRTSARLLADRLPLGALHQYAPLDFPHAARAFLAHWRPDLGVFVESELWPMLILAARAQGARLALVSAQMSPGSVRRWRRFPAAASVILRAFDLILARDQLAAAELSDLGAHVDGFADLKFGAAPLPADERVLIGLTAKLAGKRVVLAASTHPGEDSVILDAFARETAGGDHLIIAPRHPERGAAVMALVEARGLQGGLRSEGEDPSTRQVLVADSLGELGLWLRLSTLTVIGGSLIPGVGGHNPLEPARLGCPFVVGPHVDRWPVYDTLLAIGATRMLAPPGELEAVFRQALRDPESLLEMAALARAFVAERDAECGSLAPRLLALIAP